MAVASSTVCVCVRMVSSIERSDVRLTGDKMTARIVTVVGARPQFIKAAPVSKALNAAGHHEFLVHTGQHYDYEMSQIFFDELNIREPDVNLGVGSGTHGHQTGEMLISVEEILLAEKPD